MEQSPKSGPSTDSATVQHKRAPTRLIAWLAGAIVAIGAVAGGLNAIVDSTKTASHALGAVSPTERFQRALTKNCHSYAARIAAIDHRFDPSLPKIAKRRVDLQVQLIRRISRMRAPDTETRDSVQLYLAPMRLLTEFGYHRAARIPTTLGLAQDNLNAWFTPSPKAKDLMSQAKAAASDLRAPACGDAVLLWAV